MSHKIPLRRAANRPVEKAQGFSVEMNCSVYDCERRSNFTKFSPANLSRPTYSQDTSRILQILHTKATEAEIGANAGGM